MLIATNDRLKEYTARLVDLEGERTRISLMITHIYKEAKDDGFTASALRKAIKIHSMDSDKRAKHDAAQADLETYLAQLEGRDAE
jgi:uncharacterized protein (UPF0335 family)